MRKRFVYLIGSAIIGIITLMLVFFILIASGVINAEQKKIVFRSVDMDVVYNGEDLVCKEYSIVHGKLKKGHTAEVSFTGKQSGVGESENSFTVTIWDENGADVTDDYDLECIYGTLTVNKRPILITTASMTKTYDGTAHENHEWSLGGNTSVVDGHDLVVETVGSQTDVGSCKNVANIQILDKESGKDVTANYAIDAYYGEIKVVQRQILICTEDATKEHSEPVEALIYQKWHYGNEDPAFQVLPTHDIDVDISGKQLGIGRSKNEVAQVLITDKETGENKTHNYKIDYNLGYLTVLDPNADLSAEAEAVKQAFKSGGSLKDNGLSRSELVIAAVNSDKDGAVYLRAQSYGDYKDNMWSDGLEYPVLLDQRYSYNYLTGAAIKNSVDATSGQMRIRSKYQYMLPYYTSMGTFNYSIQTSDVAYASAKTEYDVRCYFYNNYGEEMTGLLGAYEDEEAAYREFVYQNYLEISDESIKDFLQGIIDEQGFDKNDPAIVSKIAEYMQNYAIYDLDYDRSLDEEENIVLAFLKDYKRGVCRHFASAATLLYRAAGIPARYTIGAVGKGAVSGKWTDIPASSIHAWVEVYIDGLGWVMVETTGGPFKYSRKVFTVSPIVTAEPYKNEDTELFALQSIRGLSELENAGYDIRVEVIGSQKGLGMSESEIKSLEIRDEYGNDITKDLNLKILKGTVQIYKAQITVTTLSAEKIYDGTSLSTPEIPVITQGNLINGDTITTLKCVSAITDVGQAINSFEIVILNSEGEDVTSHYRVVRDCGILEVKQAELYISTGSAEKEFDGEELVSTEWSLKEGYELADGHILAVVCVGSQTEIGESPNSVSKAQTKIFDGNGNDVTRNYKINYELGTLKVVKVAMGDSETP